LKDLFGSQHLIVQEVISSLDRSGIQKSAAQVRQLSFDLLNARDILTAVDAMHAVDYQFVIKSVIVCLPKFAQIRWNDQQLESKRQRGNYLRFTDLVNFVKDLADDMCDPLCRQAARSLKSDPGKAFLLSDAVEESTVKARTTSDNGNPVSVRDWSDNQNAK